MTKAEFDLMDAINREGISNDKVIFFENETTRNFFGIRYNCNLIGYHVAVCHEKGEEFCWLKKFEPDLILPRGDEEILIYSLDSF